MPIHIDYETDTLYLKGIEKERRASVIKLWKKDIELSMISNLLDLPIEYVEHIISEFKKAENY